MYVQYVYDAPICVTVRPVENAGRAWHVFAVRIVAVLAVLVGFGDVGWQRLSWRWWRWLSWKNRKS